MSGIGLSIICPGCGLGFLRLAGLLLFVFGVLLRPSLPSGGDRLSVSLWLYLVSVGHVLLALVLRLLFRASVPFLVLGEVLSVFGCLGPWGPLFCHWLLLGYCPFWK